MKGMIRALGILILAVLVAMAGLYFTRDLFLHPLARRLLAGWLESQGPADVRVRRVQGDYLTHLRITGVRTLKPGPGPLVSIRLDELALRYRLLDLYYGTDYFLKRARIEMRGAAVRIDASREKEQPPAEPAKGPPGLGLPAAWPILTAERLSLVYRGPGWSLAVRDAGASIGEKGRVRFSAGRVELNHPSVGRKAFRAQARLRVSADRLDVDRLVIDDQTMAEDSWVAWDHRSLRYCGRLRLFGGQLRAAGQLLDQAHELQVSLAGVQLANLSNFFQWEPAWQGGLTLQATARIPDRGWEGAEGRMQLQVAKVRFPGWPEANLSLTGGAAAGRLRLDKLALSTANSRLRLDQFSAPMAILDAHGRNGLAEVAGRFALEVHNIPEFLAALGVSRQTWERTLYQQFRLAGRVRAGRVVIQRGAWEWLTAPHGLQLVKHVPGGIRLLDIAGTAADVAENRLLLADLSAPLEAFFQGNGNQLLRSLRGRVLLQLEDLAALLAIFGAGQPADFLPLNALITLRLEEAGAAVQGRFQAYNTEFELQGGLLEIPAEGPLAGSRIQGRMVADVADLQALASLAGLQRASGRLTLAARVGGTLGRPFGQAALSGRALRLVSRGLQTGTEALDTRLGWQGAWNLAAWRGGLKLVGAELRLGPDLPAVKNIDLDLALRNQQVLIRNFRGFLGGSEFTMTGEIGSEAGPWPFFQTRLQGENLLFYRSEGVKVRADANLDIVGPWSQLAVVGALRLTDSRFVENIDFLQYLQLAGSRPAPAARGFHLFSIPDPPLSKARFYVQIQSERPLEIKNNLATGSVRPDLLLTGTGEVPVLIGTIYFDPTRIRLPAGNLNVESGFIRFLENNPDRPQITASATTDLLGYEVSMQVSGPLEEPTVTLTSIPPLNEEELLLLVLAGAPPKQPLQAQSALNVAVYLGLNFFTSLFGDESTESRETLLDRLQVEIGQSVTPTNTIQTVLARYLLAENFLFPNDLLYLTSERDIYGDYNLGIRDTLKFD